ncbi:MAG: GNAT family N-acetyltransferase [Bacteroidia bacterium]|nr:GNAT family N-acetyltransferase [Bacteroidia bacterium]
MFLRGPHISIRALEPSDVGLLYEWENNRSIWAVSYTQIPFSKFILEEFINTAYQDIYTSKQLRLMIQDNATKVTIGILDLFDFDPQHSRCGLGIYVHEGHRNKGVALETITLAKQYGSETLMLKQVYAHVAANNEASLALFTKAGFEKSGLKKAWTKSGLNTYEDVWFLQYVFPSE